MNPPDYLLRTGLGLSEQGCLLSHGLRIATQATIQRAAQHGHPWAAQWSPLFALAGGHLGADSLTDGCFRWIFDPRQTWFRSELAREVSDRVPVVTTPAEAVLGALLDREDVRAREAVFQRWCRQGHRLYRPDQVVPFLPRRGAATSTQRSLASLAHWVADRVTYQPDARKWGRPDVWQAPGVTLRDRSGDCEDMALVVWSAAPLLGLPVGRLVVGALGSEGHAWVEFPELGLWVEATSGRVGRLGYGSEPSAYQPWLYLYPDGRCVETGLDA